MKKIIGTCILVLLTFANVGAQDLKWNDVKFKNNKGFVVVQDVNVFKLKYNDSYFYLYDLKSDEEVMYFYLNNNETHGYSEDDFVKVFFTKSEKMFESKSHQRNIMALLINEKVFDSEWQIIDENVDKFITKYDENITNRTIRD